MTTVETEWDADTRDLVTAFDLYEDTLCPLCGQPSYVCQAMENQYRFKVLPPIRCHASTALYESQARINPDTNPVPEALLWGVHLEDGS